MDEAEELIKNINVIKQLQDTIVQMKVDGDIIYGDDIIELLEEAVVRISRLEKGLQWAVESLEMVQKEFIGEVAKHGRSKEDSSDFKWVKSLVEKNDDNIDCS